MIFDVLRLRYVTTRCPDDRANKSYYYAPVFRGLMPELARLLVAKQTDHALLDLSADGTAAAATAAAVRAEGFTKDWRGAFRRRLVAESLWDVVTIDVGARRTKFAAFGNRGRHDIPAVEEESPSSEGARRNSRGRSFRGIEVFDDGAGSFASVVAETRGHLWSAGHGLRNSLVGPDITARRASSAYGGLYNKRGPWSSDPGHSDEGHSDVRTSSSGRAASQGGLRFDVKAAGILAAYVVENTWAERLGRQKSPFDGHETIAEHPILFVEPPLGFDDSTKRYLAEELTTWHVPYLGFVNAAVASLLAPGAHAPARDGIVISVGAENAAVVAVLDAVALTARGERLATIVEGSVEGPASPAEDPPGAAPPEARAPADVAREIAASVTRVLASVKTIEGADAAARLRAAGALLTGGGASDALERAVRSALSPLDVRVRTQGTASERHLDAVRGGRVHAQLSTARQGFDCLLGAIWGVGGSAGDRRGS